MRFSLRQLFVCILAVLLIIALTSAAYRWFNHNVEYLDLGNGYGINFSSEYEQWRGTRRILRVEVAKKSGEVIDDFTCRVKSYLDNGEPAKKYLSLDSNFVVVTFPGGSGHLLIGDLRTNEFTKRHRSDFLSLGPDEPRWHEVVKKVTENNIELQAN